MLVPGRLAGGARRGAGLSEGVGPPPRARRLRAAGQRAGAPGSSARRGRGRAGGRSCGSCGTPPGFESLGIGYAALYLKVAPAERRGAAGVGRGAGRAGRAWPSAWAGAPRAPTGAAQPRTRVLAGQVAVAESYGVVVPPLRAGGARTVVCYDGDALARVLQLTAAARRAARPRGAGPHPARLPRSRRHRSPSAGPGTTRALDILGALDPRARQRQPSRASPPTACACAPPRPSPTQAHDEAGPGSPGDRDRRGVRSAAPADAGRPRRQLAPEDLPAYDETAVRVAAIRALADPTPAARPTTDRRGRDRPGPPRRDLRPPTPPATPTVVVAAAVSNAGGGIERCTFGVVLAGSLRLAPAGPHGGGGGGAGPGLDRALDLPRRPTDPRRLAHRDRPARRRASPATTSATSSSPASPPTAAACWSRASCASPAASPAASSCSPPTRIAVAHWASSADRLDRLSPLGLTHLASHHPVASLSGTEKRRSRKTPRRQDAKEEQSQAVERRGSLNGSELPESLWAWRPGDLAFHSPARTRLSRKGCVARAWSGLLRFGVGLGGGAAG